jgi:hypothetical protein
MRKIKKLLTVSTFCLACAFAMNCFSLSASNVWEAINKLCNSDKTFTEGLSLKGAEAASGALTEVALTGSGISAGASAYQM